GSLLSLDSKLGDCLLGEAESIGVGDQQVRGSFIQDLKGLDQADYRRRGGDIGGGHHWRITEDRSGVLLFAAKVLSFTATGGGLGDGDNVAARRECTRDREGVTLGPASWRRDAQNRPSLSLSKLLARVGVVPRGWKCRLSFTS